MTKFSNRIKKSSSDSSIILANDYSTNVPRLESKTIHNIKSLHKNLCAIKINFHLLLKLANNYGLQTIADIKLNDIGNTNLVAIENLDELGFDAVIANPIMGNQSLKNLVKSAHKRSMGIISLCHMSAPEARANYELNVVKQNSSKMTPLYQIFLDSALKNDSDGIIVGATYPDIIKFCKKRVGKKLKIYSPGIGVQGGNAVEAKKLGSDFLIVGRTILDAKNPIETARKLAEDSI